MPYDNFTIEYYTPMSLDNRPFYLRHDIYCAQNNFLPTRSDEREIDYYDAYAPQAVIFQASIHEPVAVVRVIPFSTAYDLPFDQFAAGYATAKHWGEVSRIGISKTARLNIQERREVMGHLFKAVYQLSVCLGVTHWACVMPAALQLRMAILGVEFLAVGEPVEYHGVRQPCVGVAHRVLSNLEAETPGLYHYVTNEGKV